MIPIDSKKFLNDASVSTVNAVLNYISFFMTLLFAVFIVPIIYRIFIIDMVKENEGFTAQQKLNRLSGIDLYASLLFIGFSISLIHVGIANNIPVFTTVGMYFFIFYLGCLTYFQYIRIFDEQRKNEFLLELVDEKKGEDLPSFEAVSNDIFGLIKSNLYLLTHNDNGDLELISGIALVVVIFTIMYWIFNAMHINMTLGGGSFFLSLPLYLALLSVYIAIVIKVQRNKFLKARNASAETSTQTT
jgi:hypothetical protein